MLIPASSVAGIISVVSTIQEKSAELLDTQASALTGDDAEWVSTDDEGEAPADDAPEE